MESNLTVPAEYADEFRHAVVQEIHRDTNYIEGHRSDLLKAAEERSNLAVHAEDLRASMRQLERDVRLLETVGYEGDGPIEIRTDDSDTLAHALESMAQRVVGPLIQDAVEVTPIDVEHAATLRPLIERLSWAADQAARFHGMRAAGVA